MSTVNGVVVVTGAAGGMGKPAAVRFAKQGRPLLLCDVNAERLDAAATELRIFGVQVDVLAGDIAAPDFPDRVLAALGGRPVAALIHTAGLSPTMADAARIFEVNYSATERLVLALRERMSEGGCAVLISSCSAYMVTAPEMIAAVKELVGGKGIEAVAPFIGTPQMAYPVSKVGVIALVAREAEAFGKRGARIASIAPGFIDTDMGRAEAKESQQMVDMIAITPLGRLGTGDEIASVAEFLCSPAASYVTGCDIKVDGGIVGRLGL